MTESTQNPESNRRTIVVSSLALGLFSLLTMGLVFVFYFSTEEEIELSEARHEQFILREIVGSDDLSFIAKSWELPRLEDGRQQGYLIVQSDNSAAYDPADRRAARSKNDDLTDSSRRAASSARADDTDDRRAAQGDARAAGAAAAYDPADLRGLILSVHTLDGYSGRIDMLVGFNLQGQVIAVGVTRHRETPGLGDKIEKAKSDWSDQFHRRGAGTNWEVAKNGGDFDALSGATISSLAVIKAVEQAHAAARHILTLETPPN